MSATRDQEEATPLLIDVQSSDAAARNNDNERSGDQEEEAEAAAAASASGEAETTPLSEPRNDGATGNTPLAAVKRALFIMTCITLGFGVVQFVFGIATCIMNTHARRRFNSSDWWMEIYFAQLIWSVCIEPTLFQHKAPGNQLTASAGYLLDPLCHSEYCFHHKKGHLRAFSNQHGRLQRGRPLCFSRDLGGLYRQSRRHRWRLLLRSGHGQPRLMVQRKL
jgi:hypothetical protein